jgi:putative enterochelin-binding protein
VPVMVIDYSDKSWEDVTTMMGKATGLEKNADEVIKKYEDRVTEVKNSINLPPQPVNIVSMTPDSMNFFTPESAQGRIFTSVGFEVATPPQELIGETSIGRQRSDAVGVVPENFGPALTGETVFAQTLKAEGKTSDKIRQNPQLAQAPAVTADRLYDLNPDAFRIDYYSAMNVLNNLEGWFKK